MAPIRPSRRSFLGSLGALSALGVAHANDLELPATGTEYRSTKDAIEVWSSGRLTQRVLSRNPAALVFNTDHTLLLAANNIDNYEGLPCGSVESYTVLPDNGHLQLLSRQSLSLSATRPRHLALSPDGRSVVVAAYGGGIYNVLPVTPDGHLQPVRQILKEIGSGVRPDGQASAHPHSVVFHPSGRFLIASDVGSDRLTVFRFRDGRLTRHSQTAAAPGSGPSHLFLDAHGSALTVRHEFSNTIVAYRFDGDRGEILATA